MNHNYSKKPVCVIDEDDKTIGHIYTRREMLRLMGATGGAFFLTACGLNQEADGSAANLAEIANTNESLANGCIVRPELTEGPIFVDDQANRSNIRTDPSSGAVSEGAPLALIFAISMLTGNSCNPLEGAQVDIWQCDAAGVYSDTNFENMGTVGQKFLRGHQFTDAQGLCNFTTIYPGWYETRAVHIHFKVRTTDGYDFTSQLFFDPSLTDKVFANGPYNTRGDRTIRNEDDGIFAESGDQMMLTVAEASEGYRATFNITLDLS